MTKETFISILEADPRVSRRLREEISISHIDDETTITEIQDALEKQPMKDDLPSWNCQDRVV